MLFIVLTYYKTGYDARESGKRLGDMFEWKTIDLGSVLIDLPSTSPERLESVAKVLPVVLATYMEIAVIASIAVAIATRLPMVVNLSICLTVFVIAHLVPVLVKTSVQQGRLEIVAFFAKFLGIIFPHRSFLPC